MQNLLGVRGGRYAETSVVKVGDAGGRGEMPWLRGYEGCGLPHRRQARARGVLNGRGGAVVIVQRFGSALNLNVHLHALVLDGVFASGAEGVVRFHAMPPAPAPDLLPLLMTIARRIQHLLARRGISEGSAGVEVLDPFADDAPILAGLAAASVRGVAALGPRAGRPVRRWGDDRLTPTGAVHPFCSSPGRETVFVWTPASDRGRYVTEQPLHTDYRRAACTLARVNNREAVTLADAGV